MGKSLRIESEEDFNAIMHKDGQINIDSPGLKRSKAAQANGRAVKQREPRNNVLKNDKGSHVIALRVIVAVIAYVLLAVGWTIGAIGDAIYEVGKRMHESKWNIS